MLTCSRFRRFIPDFARISRPLSKLTKKKAVWKWTVKQEKGFRNLKRCLVTPPILRQANPNKPFVIKTDASAYVIRACLLQEESPDKKPVEYASRLLTSSKMSYSTTERETLAVVFAV